MKRVEAYAQNLASKSASALSLTKQLLYHTDGMTLEKAIEAGVMMNAVSRSTVDAKRGFAEFRAGAKKKSCAAYSGQREGPACDSRYRGGTQWLASISNGRSATS